MCMGPAGNVCVKFFVCLTVTQLIAELCVTEHAGQCRQNL